MSSPSTLTHKKRMQHCKTLTPSLQRGRCIYLDFAGWNPVRPGIMSSCSTVGELRVLSREQGLHATIVQLCTQRQCDCLYSVLAEVLHGERFRLGARAATASSYSCITVQLDFCNWQMFGPGNSFHMFWKGRPESASVFIFRT